jgi:hypothetical protein
MIITTKTTFLHGKQRFESGKTYGVSDALGAYACMNGWASSDEFDIDAQEPEAREITLDVHSSRQGVK